MSDGAARFAARFPVVWHVIEAEGAGPWLAATGLLPAAALLRLAGAATGDTNRHEAGAAAGDTNLGEARVAAGETNLDAAGVAAGNANRDEFRLLSLGDERLAVLRPQLMADRRLAPTLAGGFAGRPGAWREHINAHVFFWTEPTRRDAFVLACVRMRARSRAAPGRAAPVVLALDTATLLGRHGEAAFFARFNTGSTVRGGARVRRDETTLAPVIAYRSGPVAELAIRGGVLPGALTARA